jgi:hypothetical protein
LANDPGGDRYVSLIDEAVAMFSEYAFGHWVQSGSD